MLLLTGCSSNSESTDSPEITSNPVKENVKHTDYSSSVYISEIMGKNTAAYSVNGCYCNYIEIRNIGDDIDIGNWTISDGKNNFVFSEGKKLLKGYNLFLEKSEVENGFSLDISEDTMVLYDNYGNVVCKVEDLDMSADQSLCIDENGNRYLTYYITPGYENTDDGYEKFCDRLNLPEGPIIINEVSNSNTSYKTLSDGSTTDWIEIKNISDNDVNLHDYYISNKNKDKKKYNLPQQILKSGEMVVIPCDDDISDDDNIHCVPFSI